jgi:hypothetical protein
MALSLVDLSALGTADLRVHQWVAQTVDNLVQQLVVQMVVQTAVHSAVSRVDLKVPT